MKMISAPRLKRGHVREDGKVFWGVTRGRSIWLSPEAFVRNRDRMSSYLREYGAKRLGEKKSLQKNPEFRVGDAREDGKVYVGWSRNGGEEDWITREQFTLLENGDITIERRSTRKNGHLVQGTLREDGMRFWQYRKRGEKIEEYWVTAEQFERRRRLSKEKLAALPRPEKRFKAGQVREDGMVFRGYNLSVRGGEIWVTREEYEAQKLHRRNHFRRNYKKNPLFSTTHKLRASLTLALRAFKNQKTPGARSKLPPILGCSLEAFKLHMESKFSVGMTWGNYGSWEVDHIKPCSSATTVEDLIRLFHFSNLQPLWGADNGKKGTSIS